MLFFVFFFAPAELLPEFDGVDKADPNCVVIGDAAEKFSYQNLNEAFRVLIGLEKPALFSLGQGYEHIKMNKSPIYFFQFGKHWLTYKMHLQN